VDEQINIVAITNEVALPIINDLLNLDSTHTVARVFELVREIVRHTSSFNLFASADTVAITIDPTSWKGSQDGPSFACRD